MKSFRLLFLLTIGFFLFNSYSVAQWSCKYYTVDDSPNGTGQRTASVAVLGEDKFVALATRFVAYDSAYCSYLVSYKAADKDKGRIDAVGYGAATLGVFGKWGSGADTVRMYNAWKVVAQPKKNLVYVANNDKDHSILTFTFTDAGLVSAPYRMKTGTNKIWGIDVDDNGKVYVVVDSVGASVTTDVMIFEAVDKETKWSTTHDAAPIKTIDLAAGIYKGLAVDGSGKFLFISDYLNKKVLKYVGSPTTGYSPASGFDFKLTLKDSIPGRIPLTIACPMGLSYMRTNNILLVACDTLFRSNAGFSSSYTYGRVYLVDPNTGKLAGVVLSDSSLSVIDQAAWNYAQAGSYGTSTGCSGLASTFDVGYDDQGNVYSQSYYGWTVEKWSYFPFMGSITKIKKLSDKPEGYTLKQNYPNPFNPSTNIEFSVPKSSLVTLKVYNLLGQEIVTLVDKSMEAGSYIAAFNASKVSSGTYFYELHAGDYTSKMKMILMK
jgi:hypothetical protein